MMQRGGKGLPGAIGRYQVLEAIGRGSMGAVYRARDPVLGRTVALKVIEPLLADAEGSGEEYERRFLIEARLAAQLQHPAIVVVHDFGRDAGTGALFMALEHLEGRTLEQVVRAGPLDWREAARIVARIAHGLHYAHLRGIVHRDVKPANVMLLASGEPKIMDFGIAKAPASTLTAAGQVFGTPANMSPEQAKGEKVDARSDVFSLGTVLHHLLTGRRAFEAASLPGLLAAVIGEQPAPPSAGGLGIPERMDAVLARALAKRPEDRYPSAAALAEDLEALLAQEPAPRAAQGAVPEATPPAEPVFVLASLPPASLEPGAPPTHPPASERTRTVALPAGGAGPARAPRRLHLRLAVAACALAALAAALLLARRPAELPAPFSALAEPARIDVSFEHHLGNGNLRLFVDGQPVLDEDLAGRVTRRVLGVELRTGRLAKTIEVAPGRHEVRAQVRWSDGERSETIWGNIEAGKTRRLAIGLGRIRKDLSLEWR